MLSVTTNGSFRSIFQRLVSCLLVPLLTGLVAVLAINGIGVWIAFGSVPGSLRNYWPICWVAIPAAILNAFLLRRQGVIFAVLGALVFAFPITIICLGSVTELSPTDIAEIPQWHQIWLVFMGMTLFATVLFSAIMPKQMANLPSRR
jgi:hypothetical protein